jgi:hypothetical protein
MPEGERFKPSNITKIDIRAEPDSDKCDLERKMR